jgi:hypothetical protein
MTTIKMATTATLTTLRTTTTIMITRQRGRR